MPHIHIDRAAHRAGYPAAVVMRAHIARGTGSPVSTTVAVTLTGITKDKEVLAQVGRCYADAPRRP
jgi:hypothetical protein